MQRSKSLGWCKSCCATEAVEPLPVFKDYYKNQLSGCKDVLMTSGEYDLDFMKLPT